MEKGQRKRMALRMVLLVFVSVVFGVGIYSWNAKSLTGNVMPMPFGIGMGVVMSGSMEPELSVDDLIIVKERKSYEVGEIVVYQQRKTLVVHKIIEINGEEVITQGTANNAEDDPIPMSAIKGEVVFHVDKIGVIVNWIKSPFGTILILLAAIGLLAKSYANEKEESSDELEDIKREIENLKKQKEETPTNTEE